MSYNGLLRVYVCVWNSFLVKTVTTLKLAKHDTVMHVRLRFNSVLPTWYRIKVESGLHYGILFYRPQLSVCNVKKELRSCSGKAADWGGVRTAFVEG